MNAVTAAVEWEVEIAALLERLAAAQGALLALLGEKRKYIIARDHDALTALAGREHELAAELVACQAQRADLLARAGEVGLPDTTLVNLNGALPAATRRRLTPPLDEARQRAQLVRHECLAQWVAVQRSVLHLAQILEIYATGGRGRPTYGDGIGSQSGGSLINQAV